MQCTKENHPLRLRTCLIKTPNLESIRVVLGLFRCLWSLSGVTFEAASQGAQEPSLLACLATPWSTREGRNSIVALVVVIIIAVICRYSFCVCVLRLFPVKERQWNASFSQ